MIKIIKIYIQLMLLTIVAIPLCNAMEAQKEEVREESSLESLPPEMLSKILEYVIYETNKQYESPRELDEALKNLYLINHLIYDLTHSTSLQRIIQNLIIDRTRKLKEMVKLIKWVNKNPIEADQEFILKVESGDIKRLKALLIAGVNIDAQAKRIPGIKTIARTFNGNTALMVAVEAGNQEIIRILLAEGADINAKNNPGDTALMAAVEAGNQEMIRILLSEGADLNAKNNSGTTALMIASKKGNQEMVKILLAEGADVNLQDNKGNTALKIAVEKYYSNKIATEEIVKMLLEANAKVNIQGEFGNTALISAAFFGSKKIVNMLLDAGADATLQNISNGTALVYANEQGYPDIAQLLEESVKATQEKKDF